MIFGNILLLALSALGFTVASRYDSKNNGFGTEQNMMEKQVNAIFPWSIFSFTNVGYHTNVSLPLALAVPYCVRVTDLYCTGDMFAVYYGGIFQFNTSIPAGINCTNPFTDPDAAFFSPGISHGQGLVLGLPVANLTIIPIQSPYTAGLGAYGAVPGLCPLA